MDPRRRFMPARALAAALLLAAFASLALAGLGLPAAHAKKRASAAVSARIVSIARRELAHGVREIPDGSNRAPAIYRYDQATTPHWYGAPWCAYFVSYVTRRAGVPIGAGGSGLGYVPYIRSWAKQTGRWTSRPRPGELIAFPQHVGIVESVYSNHTLTTIEGNSGNAVRRVWRRWSEAMGYVRVASGGAITPMPSPKRKPAATGPKQRLVARITAYPSTKVAVGQTVDFTSNDSSGKIAKQDWDLDGNGHFDAHGDNVQRRYDRPGTYNVKLRIADAAKHTATATVAITVKDNRAPVARMSLSATQIEVGKTLSADASSSYDPDGRIVEYSWDLDGDGNFGAAGSRRTMTFDRAGDYYPGLRVKDDDGNVTEVHVPVHVYDHPDPVVRLTCDHSSLPTGGTLRCHADDSSSPTRIVRREWDMNDDGQYGSGSSDVSYTYGTPGKYTAHVKVTDANGRVAYASVDVVVTNRPPSAKISAPAAKVLVNQPATFSGTGTTDPDGSVLQWEWDFDGDGLYDRIGSSVSWTYTTWGPRVIAMRATDDLGGTSVTTTNVNVLAPPVAAFSVTTPAPTAGQPVTFDPSASYDPDGHGVAKYAWTWGNGSSTRYSSAPVSRTYASPGTYTVKLVVTDGDGVASGAYSATVVVG